MKFKQAAHGAPRRCDRQRQHPRQSTIPGLDSVDFWTSRQAAIPRSSRRPLAILGGSTIGVELGSIRTPRLQGDRDRSWTDVPGLEEPEAAALYSHSLEADGITLIIGGSSCCRRRRCRRVIAPDPRHRRSF